MSNLRNKIGLYGLYGWGSLGDAAVQEAVIAWLRCNRPDAEIYCICPNPKDATERFGLPAYPINLVPSDPLPGQNHPVLKWVYRIALRVPIEVGLWLRPVRRLKGFEMLVISGGGQLEDYGVSAFRYPYDLYKWSWATKLTGTKLKVVSVGAGPLRSKLSRWFVRQALGRSAYRSYRDLGSRNFLCSIGLPYETDPVAPDMAFGLQVPEEVRGLASARMGARPIVVGMTGMCYYDARGWPMYDQAVYERYLGKLTEITAWLLTNGYGVRFLVGDVWNDRRTVDDIIAGIKGQGIEPTPGQMVAEPIYGVSDLLRETAQVDYVVSSRFHVILFGLLLGKPAISIAYNQKSDSIMRSFGLGDYCHQIADFAPEQVCAQIGRLDQEAELFKPEIERVARQYQQQFDDQCRTVFGVKG